MTDHFQQFVQTQQVQTQQVQADNAAVQAIDKAVASLGIREAFDARMQEMFEGLIDVTRAGFGKIKENMSKGISYASNKIDGLSNGLASPNTPTIREVNQRSAPEKTPEISQDLAQYAKMSVGLSNQFQCQDVEMGSYVSPSHSPNAIGVSYGGQAIG